MKLPEPITFAPLTRTDLVRYAGASGDFNPLHHDHAFASEAGLPDVMAHGMLSAGLLATALTRWFGPDRIVRYAVRFRSPVWPGDRLTARCEDAKPTDDDPACVDVEIVLLRNGGDDVVLSGAARVRLAEMTPEASEGP